MSAPRIERILTLYTTDELAPPSDEVWRIVSGRISHVTGTPSWLTIGHKGQIKTTLGYVNTGVGTLVFPLGTYQDGVIGADHTLVVIPYIPVDEVNGAEGEFISFVGDASANAVVVIEVRKREGAQQPAPITSEPTPQTISTTPDRTGFWM